jgi:CDP-diacylglycerol pyrophosphatase
VHYHSLAVKYDRSQNIPICNLIEIVSVSIFPTKALESGDKVEIRSNQIGLAIALVIIGLGVIAKLLIGDRDPDALWNIVHARCVPDQANQDNPAPCISVDLNERWAVLKDARGKAQLLLIPTDRVTGVEDPQILAADAPNYWQAAWKARLLVGRLAPRDLSDDEFAFAINSKVARSQEQLHIHIDCIRPDVHDALEGLRGKVGPQWIQTEIIGQRYMIRELEPSDLHTQNLFALVAGRLAHNENMENVTIVLARTIPANGKSRFDLLVGRAGDGGNNGGGEDLEDHTCAIANVPIRRANLAPRA